MAAAAAAAAAVAAPGLIRDILDNRPENVLLRLRNGEDPNQISVEGVPAIYVAIEQNNAVIVNYLLHYHANIDYIDNVGNTTLHFAVELPVKDIQIIRALCVKANDVLFVHARNNAGQTPYHFAAVYQTPVILDYLGRQGGSPYGFDDHHQTPLLLAAGSGNLPNVRFLKQWVGMLDVPDEFGRTPIYVAAEMGFLDVVDYLIRVGANANIRNVDGITPMGIASMNGHDAVVRLFRNVIKQRLAGAAWTRRREAISAWAAAAEAADAASAPHAGLPRENAVHPNIPGRRNQGKPRKTRRNRR